MSSGACRALVAVLLTLVATTVMTVPAAAQDEQPVNTESSVTYDVDPANGTIDVDIRLVMTPTRAWKADSVWKQLIIEDRTKKPTATSGFSVRTRQSRDVPGLYRAVDLETPALPAGKKKSVLVRYSIDARADQNENRKSQTPARIDNSYMYFCVPGQDTQTGRVTVKIKNADKWKPTQLGTPMEATEQGFRSRAVEKSRSGDIFTCFEGVRTDLLQTRPLIAPDGREVELQAWRSLARNWLPAALDIVPGDLKTLHDFLGYDIPGEGTLIIRQAPSSEIGGYAGAHGTPGIVQLDEGPDPESDTVHQLAHAWFGTDNFIHFWLREGMAEWTSSSISGAACEPITANPFDLDLSDDEWLVVEPQAPEDIEQLIEAQEAAACGIVTAVAERMPEEQWREVIGSMLQGETKYVGSAGPEIGTSRRVDWREWLDAVDERGLVPAAADPEYAANMDDLDFAQDLLAEFDIQVPIPGRGDQLAERSEARAAYHEFLDYIEPLGAPRAVRKDMDDWDFVKAMARIEASRNVFDQLTEADGNLPEADLVRIMKPQFEAARDEAELQEVARLVDTILEETRTIVGPLGDLQEVLEPLGWTQPAAIIDAIGQRRFPDAKAAITPAIEAARAISAANEALPEAGFLDQYRPLYEIAPTAARLREIEADAASDARNAQLARNKFEQLQAAVGDWTIPLAVTAPLGSGQLQAARVVMDDGLAVVRAATEADEALPEAGLREEVRPKFEAVQTGAEMALLREEYEQRAGDATTVGEALSTLNLLVPGWEIPAVVAEPVAAGDFAGAVDAATEARNWVEAANEANQLLRQLDAMNRTQPLFESASSLEDLQDGAERARRWANAAGLVRLAIDENNKPRDLLTSFGLWGVSVDPIVEDAIAAAIAGEVEEAIQLANDALHALRGGQSAGSLRLAGVVFLGVAVLGVLGLWVMLRRQAGPSWARSTKPHWVDDDQKGGLFGRRKKKDQDKK